MREILFRGKRVDNGEWVEGFLVVVGKWYYILTGKLDITKGVVAFEGFEVISETVGQFTGLTDKNGKPIYEGDIVHAVYKSNYIGVPDKCFGDGVVEYRGSYYENASYRMNMIGEPGYRIFSSSLKIRVIGNVFDNPELLEVSGDA